MQVNQVFTGISAKNSDQVARAKGGLKYAPTHKSWSRLLGVGFELLTNNEVARAKGGLEQNPNHKLWFRV
jgi:hypothetical protein